MLTPINEIEDILKKNHQRMYCLLTGNGTTALYLSLKSFGIKNQKIGIPSGVCSNVPLAIYLSENEPYYLDIDPDDMGINCTALNKNIHKLGAIIAVHSYGSVCKIEQIEKLCRGKGIPLIEDAAVAQGAWIGNKPIGSFGSISILSFGVGKIISVEHGGALLTDNLELLEKANIFLAQLKYHDEIDEEVIGRISALHTKLYNKKFLKGEFTKLSAFKELSLQRGFHYLYQFNSKYLSDLKFKLDEIRSQVNNRERKSEYFAEKIRSSQKLKGKMEIFVPPQGSVYWRFSVFIKNRNYFLKKLLDKKIKVSSWYPPVQYFYEEKIDLSQFSIAKWVGENILNFWVNEEVDYSYIDGIIHFLESE